MTSRPQPHPRSGAALCGRQAVATGVPSMISQAWMMADASARPCSGVICPRAFPVEGDCSRVTAPRGRYWSGGSTMAGVKGGGLGVTGSHWWSLGRHGRQVPVPESQTYSQWSGGFPLQK